MLQLRDEDCAPAGLRGVITLVMAAGEDSTKEIHGLGGIALPAPPPTPVKPVTETIGGRTVTDNYRWLEDAKSPETRAWVIEQERYTQEYLAQVKVPPRDHQASHRT